MSSRLITLQSAAEDISEAYNYYEEIRNSLGDRFLKNLLEKYNEISNHPRYYGFIDELKTIRDVKIKDFPYQIVYEIKEDSVIIYRVYNSYRNPDKSLRK